MGGRVVHLGEAEALVVVVRDGEALEEVRELAQDVQERLVPRLEEGGVPGAGPAGELVAFLSRWSAFDHLLSLANTYGFGVRESGLVDVEHAEEIGTQIGEDEEVTGGVQNGLVRAGHVLGVGLGLGVGREELGRELSDGPRVGDVVRVNATSGAASRC